MMHTGRFGFASPLFRGLVLGTVFLLVACGGEGDADPTAEPTTNSAAPTVPSAQESTADINDGDLTMVTVEPAEATADADVVPSATAAVTESSPAPAPTQAPVTGEAATAQVSTATPTNVDLAETPDTQSTPSADTPDDDAPLVSSTRTPTGNEWTQSAGDGTGGSGAPGEQEPGDVDVNATPQATPGVATLTVQSCEVPDVPSYAGDQPEQILTAEVNFRSGPGVDCDPLSETPLPEGQPVTVIGGPVTQGADDSEWVQIDVDGRQGWVTTEFLEPAAP